MGRNKVKPEQASKVLMRIADPPVIWGRAARVGKAIDTRHPTRSARGSGYGTVGRGGSQLQGGDPSRTRVAASASHQAGGHGGSRTGQ